MPGVSHRRGFRPDLSTGGRSALGEACAISRDEPLSADQGEPRGLDPGGTPQPDCRWCGAGQDSAAGEEAFGVALEFLLVLQAPGRSAERASAALAGEEHAIDRRTDAEAIPID